MHNFQSLQQCDMLYFKEHIYLENAQNAAVQELVVQVPLHQHLCTKTIG